MILLSNAQPTGKVSPEKLSGHGGEVREGVRKEETEGRQSGGEGTEVGSARCTRTDDGPLRLGAEQRMRENFAQVCAHIPH